MQADSLPAEPQGKPKNTGVGSLPLLQEIFLTQESNRGLLHCRRILYQLSYQGAGGKAALWTLQDFRNLGGFCRVMAGPGLFFLGVPSLGAWGIQRPRLPSGSPRSRAAPIMRPECPQLLSASIRRAVGLTPTEPADRPPLQGHQAKGCWAMQRA